MTDGTGPVKKFLCLWATTLMTVFVAAMTALHPATDRLPRLIEPQTVVLTALTAEAASVDPMSIPVLIVHGTWSKPLEVEPLKASLESQGFTVYSFLYGQGFSLVSLLDPTIGGIGDINVSVTQLAAEIAQVRSESGSEQIDLVGHSQGGLLIKDYLQTYDDLNVAKVVDLGASNHGTDFAGGALSLLQYYEPGLAGVLTTIFGAPAVEYFTSGTFILDTINQFPAVLQPGVRWLLERFIDVVLGIAPRQQLRGSSFITALNATPDTKPGVDYLVIGSRNDEIVAPYTSTYLSAVPGADVRNVEVHTLPGVQPDDVILHDDLLVNEPVARAVGEFLAAPSPTPHPDTGVTTTIDGGTTTVSVVTVDGGRTADAKSKALVARSHHTRTAAAAGPRARRLAGVR